jgi:hypothetical protein
MASQKPHHFANRMLQRILSGENVNDARGTENDLQQRKDCNCQLIPDQADVQAIVRPVATVTSRLYI